ncbi:unnamed protein product, partial [Cuscuta epithymum]
MESIDGSLPLTNVSSSMETISTAAMTMPIPSLDSASSIPASTAASVITQSSGALFSSMTQPEFHPSNPEFSSLWMPSTPYTLFSQLPPQFPWSQLPPPASSSTLPNSSYFGTTFAGSPGV